MTCNSCDDKNAYSIWLNTITYVPWRMSFPGTKYWTMNSTEQYTEQYLTIEFSPSSGKALREQTCYPRPESNPDHDRVMGWMLYQRASLADGNLAIQNLYSTLIIKYGHEKKNKVKATSAIFDYPLFMYRYWNYKDNAKITHEFAEFAVEYSMWDCTPKLVYWSMSIFFQAYLQNCRQKVVKVYHIALIHYTVTKLRYIWKYSFLFIL
jgi:hypothetical protein